MTVSRFTKGARDNDQRIRMMGIRNVPLHAVQRVALPVAFSFGGYSQRIKMRRLVQRQRKARLAASDLRQPFGLLLCTAAQLQRACRNQGRLKNRRRRQGAALRFQHLAQTDQPEMLTARLVGNDYTEEAEFGQFLARFCVHTICAAIAQLAQARHRHLVAGECHRGVAQHFLVFRQKECHLNISEALRFSLVFLASRRTFSASRPTRSPASPAVLHKALAASASLILVSSRRAASMPAQT